MKHLTTALLGLGIPALCLATTAPPYGTQCDLLDRIAVSATFRPDNFTIAFELLKRVGEGRTEDIATGLEARLGVAAGQLQQKEFTVPTVRACAFRAIGEIGSPEALDFLSNIKQVDLGPDASGMIWPAAQTGLANARLKGIADAQSKIEFLERLVSGGTPASFWAVNQLCDRGSLLSIAIVRPYMIRAWSGQYGEDEARFCEARMRVVARDPDRAKALGSILSAENLPQDDRLVRWAIHQLAEMPTPSAEAELKRFGAEIGKPSGDPSAQQRLWTFRPDIDYSLERNRQLKARE